MRLRVTGILAAVMITGCAGNPTALNAVRSINTTLEKDYAPYRYSLHERSPKIHVSQTEWAGTPGASIVTRSAELQADVDKYILNKCGFTADQRLETRQVSIKPPIVHEVWIYRDNQSESEDKISGISVILKQLPGNGGVDFGTSESCHSKKMPEFIYS